MTTPILRRRAARCATALLLSGCGAQDLANTWELARLRVLAIAAEPAELRPGETTALRSLVYVPTGATFGTGIWIGCLPSAADSFGCGGDSSALESLAELDPATATPEELAAALETAREAGLLGIDPFLPPTWTAPTDALDGLDPFPSRRQVRIAKQRTTGLAEADQARALLAAMPPDPDVEWHRILLQTALQ